MAARKTPAEWDRIELEYLAGEDSIREIADRHDVSEGAVRKRAKKENWVRIVQKVRKPRPAAGAPRTEPVAFEPLEAAVIAERARQLVGRMLGELEDAIFDETEDDESDRRRDAMLKAISLGGRAMTVKNLATALKTINEAGAPVGKKQAAQDKANEIGKRFAPLGKPTLVVSK